MSTELKRAFFLHSRAYRETSAILDLFTEKHGRINAVMRGVRGKSKRAAYERALLQPFVELSCDYRGRTELKTLTHFDALSAVPQVQWQQKQIYAALYLSELLSRVLPIGEAMPQLYARYADTLVAIQQVDLIEVPLRKFEFALLNVLGFALDFRRDEHHQPIDSAKYYSYEPERGFAICARSQKNQQLYCGQDLLSIGALQLNQKDVLTIAKKIARQALIQLLEGKALQARQLYKTLL